MPHVDQLVDETRSAHFFTKLDLAVAYMQFRIQEKDQFKTSFRVLCGQYEFRNESALALSACMACRWSSCADMRYMHSIFGRPGLLFYPSGRAQAADGPPDIGPGL